MAQVRPETTAPAQLYTEAEISKHAEVEEQKTGCCLCQTTNYMFNQGFAIVRHADRLDHTPDWASYPEREAYPNDTPLAEIGFKHAAEVAQVLQDEGRKWKVIVCSPYYRCAQTASVIAKKLQIPIHFDLDLGEVFDRISMVGECKGKPQHRPPDVLEKKLKEREEFREGVEYIRDDKGKIIVEGKLQKFPEPFEGARMRYCYKVKKLVQQASAELNSIIIVTHGDAVAAVVGMLKETWIVKHIPYTAYVIGSRKVKVMEKGKGKILDEEPVYVHPEQWSLKMHPDLKHEDVAKKDLNKAHKLHEKEMEEMNKNRSHIKTGMYTLTPAQHKEVEDSLSGMDASQKDKKALLKKANSTTFGKNDRIQCRISEQPDEKAVLD
jgi:broad specificity phosphatase PhoE